MKHLILLLLLTACTTDPKYSNCQDLDRPWDHPDSCVEVLDSSCPWTKIGSVCHPSLGNKR